MTIVYAVVCRARDAAILCEVSSEALTGNAPQVTTALLEHLRDNPWALEEGDLKTFVHRNDQDVENGGGADDFFSQFMNACTIAVTTTDADLDIGAVQEHYFHLWHQDGVYYCCLSDDPVQRQQKVNFAYLQAVARDFTARYTARKINNANAYAMDKDFSPNMRTSMHYYNTNQTRLSRDEEINRLLTKVEDLKALLGKNLTLLLDRETKLENLVQKSEQARIDSMAFKKRTKQVRKEGFLKSNKLTIVLVVGALMLFYIILTARCGLTFKNC